MGKNQHDAGPSVPERVRTATRVSAGVALVLSVGCVLAGCSEAGVPRADAERSVVDLVQASTDALGGDWTLYRGPDAEVCTRSVGQEGARFVFILERRGADGGDPAADIRTIEELWKTKGITTERFESGGADPLTGIRGVDGPVTSIGFNAYPQRYSITGVSKCSDGDVQELRQAE